MIEKLKQFVLEVGRYSLEKRGTDNHRWGFKWGNEAIGSLVTEVDLNISRKFKEFVEENFSDLNYMIIDEESVSQLKGRVFEKAEETEYQFILDPIDGTINYAADVPLYGVLLAVFKNKKPLYGFIYAPALDELVYTDGKEVYYENGGKVRIMEKNKHSISRIVQGHAWAVELKDKHMDGPLIMQDYFAAVMYFLYLILGKFKGVFVRANLWDIAPALAICDVLGMGFYDYETKEKMTEFSPRFFHPECKVKKVHIVCFPEEFDEIKSITAGLKE
ncbi:MAG: inositol monophosphatase family protein [Alphaproteobacteria bacterium]